MSKEAQYQAIRLVTVAMAELCREIGEHEHAWLDDQDRLRMLLDALDYVYAPEYAEMRVA